MSIFEIKRGFSTRATAFSIVEVVVATAIFAAAIVAIMGLMAPMSRQVGVVIDSETASRLAQSIQAEIERIGFSAATSTAFLASLSPNSAVPVQLVGTVNGSRVLLQSGLNPANNPLNDLTLPGIAERDRFFLIELETQAQAGPLAFDDTTSGFLALKANVTWPYRLPVGVRSSTSSATSDPSRLFPAIERQSIAFSFALNP